ncbi:MAG TPA: serine hydrolase [Xanthomonadales bacterium]|nr:serine hydrolase [Xanthomonadales bacterium]
MIDYSKFPHDHPRKKNTLVKFLLLLIAITSFLYIFSGRLLGDSRQASEFVSPLAQGIIEKGAAFLNPDENSTDLEKIVHQELRNSQGEYAVAIKNLQTGERYYFNEQEVFDAASLYKLFVMATVYQKIQDGNLTKTKMLSQKIPTLNQKFKISSESAELKEGSITLPVESALTRMITISDNYSALLLAENVRLSKVSTFLKKNSFTGSSMGTGGNAPATTASDMTSFFQKLYKGELTSVDGSSEMLLLLRHQQLNSKLPKYLPPNTRIAHKTGELGRLSHDAGIVYTQKGDYIIVVLSDTNIPANANEKIADISKAVYDYFTR